LPFGSGGGKGNIKTLSKTYKIGERKFSSTADLHYYLPPLILDGFALLLTAVHF
jgi:hypothetical protein